MALVFGPKVVRVLRGQGDQWDNRSRVRGISASFSLNGIGLVPEESPDLYQENEELKVRGRKCSLLRQLPFAFPLCRWHPKKELLDASVCSAAFPVSGNSMCI